MRDARQRLVGLDHLRALAIVSVFAFHYRLFANQPLIRVAGEFGWSGVDLFFVLSGFLIASQLFTRYALGGRVRWSEFYGKRLFRTLPPYLVVLALYFAVPQLIERGALPPLWKFVTFTQNLSMELPGKLAFSHAWSLCVEEHFYLLLPVFCMVFVRPGWTRAGAWLIGLLMAGGAALRAFLWLRLVEPLRTLPASDVPWYKLVVDPTWARLDGLHHDTPAFNIAWYKIIYYPTWTRLDGLLVGVALAAFVVFCPGAAERAKRHANAFLAFGIALLGAACWLCHDQRPLAATVLGFPAFSVAYGAIVLSALSPTGLLQRLDSRASRFLAAISYSFYLTHKSIIHLTQRVLEGHVERDGVLAFALCFALAVAGGAALHYAVERPALRLRDRWLSLRSPARLPAVRLECGMSATP
ncbi:MAG: acyltransferase [Myxococcales bacterium]